MTPCDASALLRVPFNIFSPCWGAFSLIRAGLCAFMHATQSEHSFNVQGTGAAIQPQRRPPSGSAPQPSSRPQQRIQPANQSASAAGGVPKWKAQVGAVSPCNLPQTGRRGQQSLVS
jgi:hypothetical protein